MIKGYKSGKRAKITWLAVEDVYVIIHDIPAPLAAW